LTEDFPALAGFRAGSLVAGYRLEAQVGAGGMAVVFRARDERLGRLVALKILAPALAADEGFQRRFIAESRAAATVDDPHIIPVYEAGEAGGVLFIAMRFVAGGDLRRVLAREGPLPPGRAAGFISPVASALDAAHRAGLVHRDIKPANILVDAREDRPDHVYLSDFGVSKGAMSSVSVTGTGQFLGTPEFSAPEQIQGLTLDGRADQYALACVAYQLLTSSAPFERDQGLAVLLAHLSEPPPSLGSRRPDLPRAADQVLARALAKAPEERYGSCRDFAEALRGALGLAPYTSPGLTHLPTQIAPPRPEPPGPEPEPPRPDPAQAAKPSDPADLAAFETVDAVPRDDHAGAAAAGPAGAARAAAGNADARPPGPQSGTPTPELDQPTAGGRPARRPRRRSLAIALGCVTLAVAGVITFLLAIPSSPGPPATPHSSSSPGHVEVATKSPATALPDPGKGGQDTVAFSHNGTLLAVGENNGSIYLWNVATKRLAATLSDPASDGVDAVAFSPDGTMLAAGDLNGNAYLWNVATKGLAATLSTGDGGAYPVDAVAFSPNGGSLAFGDNESLSLWNVATKRLAATLTDPAGATVDSVAFSPTGSVLAAGGSTLDPSQNLVGSTVLWNVANETVTTTLTDPTGDNVDAVAFSLNGGLLAAGDTNGNAYLWNLATDSLAATVPSDSGNGIASVAFSPSGGLLAVGDLTGSTYLWNVATKSLATTLASIGGRSVDSVAFSPQGATLAVGESNGNAYLWDRAHY
jgi:serine/threonine protein kinase